MKYLFLSLLLIVCSNLFADTPGSGCKIEDKVYTEFLGNAPPYGPENGNKKYYRATNYIPMYYGYGYNQHQGYKCGFINVYPQSSYYNGSTNVPIEAENEISSSSFSACVISNSLGGKVIADGNYVTYTYNKTDKCAISPPTGVPIDDYLFLFASVFTIFCVYSIRENYLINMFIK